MFYHTIANHDFKPFFWILSILITLMLFCSLPGFAAAPAFDQQLKQMEEQLFARTYPQESTQVRLDRLEQTVFGTPKTQESPTQRVQRLSQFFKNPHQSPITTVAPQPTLPPLSPEIVQRGNNVPQQPPTVSGDESRYPAVVAMEQKVFQRIFEQDSIETRLSRLEQRVLGQPQNGSLQERTDQLRLMVLGDTGTGDPAGSMSHSNPGNADGIALPDPNAISADLLQALPPVEKRILRQTFPQDSVESRISRLETKLFNATAPEMSLEDRFYRIVSVANAKRSGRQEQAYYNYPNGAQPGGAYGRYGQQTGGSMNVFGSMLLMLLMSLI